MHACGRLGRLCAHARKISLTCSMARAHKPSTSRTRALACQQRLEAAQTPQTLVQARCCQAPLLLAILMALPLFFCSSVCGYCWHYCVRGYCWHYCVRCYCWHHCVRGYCWHHCVRYSQIASSGTTGLVAADHLKLQSCAHACTAQAHVAQSWHGLTMIYPNLLQRARSHPT